MRRMDWEKAYDAASDVSIIYNTLYIAGTKISCRASDWYGDITKVQTVWSAVPKIKH